MCGRVTVFKGADWIYLTQKGSVTGYCKTVMNPRNPLNAGICLTSFEIIRF
jgi:hypothetical protein